MFISFFFFGPTDRPTFTRGRAKGNETFYWDGHNRDRRKQNGDIITIFSLITIILVFKSRKEGVKGLLSRGCFHRLAGFDKIVRVILL